MAKRISTIIFDLDDTLIPSSQFYAVAEKAVLGDSAEEILAFREARRQVKADLPPLHCSARNRLLYFKRYLELVGGRQSPIELYDKYEGKLCQLIRGWSSQHKRLDLLQELKRNYQLYVLTNENTRSQLAKIQALCAGNSLFDGILTSEEAGCEKPDLRIFHLLISRFGIEPDRSYFVGDSWENDMVPAAKIGIDHAQTLEFIDVPQQNEGPETQRIHHLSELMDIL